MFVQPYLNNLRIDILQDLRLDLGVGYVGDSLLFVVELLPGRFALLLGQILVDLVLQQGVVIVVFEDQILVSVDHLREQSVLRDFRHRFRRLKNKRKVKSQ